jgi:BirA family transcriptional regulator, biotin operon repressor / biotin---[acetyl-CoA-carboxylase] ligase
MVCAMSEPGFSVRRFSSLDSTNRYLLDEARAGAPTGLVAVADFQTEGRGRLGRRWEAPPGAALLASVLLRPRLAAEDLPLCASAVGLAAVDVCVARGVAAGLKWPNDLVVEDRKLAGILAEAVGSEPDGTRAVVVGIGMNLTWAGPADAGGTSLADAGAIDVGRDGVLEALLAALRPRARALGREAGRRRLATEQRDRSATLGRRVRVELADGCLEGVAVDLLRPGVLVVETASGPVEVTTADVVHLRPL